MTNDKGQGTVNIRVRCFALAADLLGARELTVELAARSTVADLLTHLSNRSPAFAKLRDRMRVAVGTDYAEAALALNDGDEAVIIPPVSGGCGRP